MTLNDTKINNYVIIASLKSESTCKLEIKYQVCVFGCLALRMHDELLNKLHNSTSVLKAFLDKLDMKSRSPTCSRPILYLYHKHTIWIFFSHG